jgi:hypothetical protein
MALSERRNLLGDTSRTGASLHKVAWLLHERKDYVDSEYLLLPKACNNKLTRCLCRNMLLQALTIFRNSYEGKGAVGRSSYLMSTILDALGRADEAKDMKRFAADIRYEILGIPADEDDTLESYDKLVGALDR